MIDPKGGDLSSRFGSRGPTSSQTAGTATTPLQSFSGGRTLCT